ncbi:hypothetical protein MRX96_029419 [Rhipicephalus microplus]
MTHWSFFPTLRPACLPWGLRGPKRVRKKEGANFGKPLLSSSGFGKEQCRDRSGRGGSTPRKATKFSSLRRWHEKKNSTQKRVSEEGQRGDHGDQKSRPQPQTGLEKF